jgi:hypothetical protein
MPATTTRHGVLLTLNDLHASEGALQLGALT